jgi:DNA-binding beta-propeller fold protein YncE
MRRLRWAIVAVLVLAAPSAASATPGPWVDPGKIAISPDGRDLYATGYRTLSFRRDQSSGKLSQIDDIGPPGGSIAITPDGAHVYVGYRSPGVVGAAIHVLSRDPSTGLLTHESTFVEDAQSHIPPGQVVDLAVSPDGRFLYVTQQSENAVLVLGIDPATGALRLEQALYGGPDGNGGPDQVPFDLALGPDGGALYVAATDVLSYSRNPISGRLTRLPPPTGDMHVQAWRLAISPDGARVYAGVAAFMAYDRDEATGRLTERELSHADDFPACFACGDTGPLAVSPDSSLILQVQSGDNRLLEWARTAQGASLAHYYDGLPGASDGDGVAWSPDGRFAYVSGGERVSPEGIRNSSLGGNIATLRRDGDGLTSVSALTPTPPSPSWGQTEGVSVDGGAIYTNDPHVRLTVRLPGWTPASFRVSNDPNFDDVRPTRATGQSDTYDWTLDTSAGPVRSVKHVWVRFTGNGAYPDTVVSDDVILDQVAPQIVSARIKRTGKRSRLTVQARDNRSGVRWLQITRDRRKPGKARKFSSRTAVSGSRRALFLRVVDGAGNYSAWKRAAVSRSAARRG